MKECFEPLKKSDMHKITEEFLVSEGWVVISKKPLYTCFTHSKNGNIRCTIGKYSEFYIAEMHWCNGTPDRIFDTINHNLTVEDYHTIIRFLGIKL